MCVLVIQLLYQNTFKELQGLKTVMRCQGFADTVFLVWLKKMAWAFLLHF